MTWRVIHKSVKGTSHRDCQDSCLVKSISKSDNLNYLICIASDGAGSALNGKQGAEIACKSAILEIEKTLDQTTVFTQDIVMKWVENIRQAILLKADEEKQPVRDYACTLIGTVIGNDCSVFFQKGDGAIVTFKGTKTLNGRIIFWPASGLYPNMTYFITDEDIYNKLYISIQTEYFDDISIFTDGLQSLALDFKTRTAYIPFFESMINILRNQSVNELDILENKLTIFLESPQVNERTDDDKTFILATRYQ